MGLPAAIKRAAAPGVISSRAFCCLGSHAERRARNRAFTCSTCGDREAAARSIAAVARNPAVNPFDTGPYRCSGRSQEKFSLKFRDL